MFGICGIEIIREETLNFIYFVMMVLKILGNKVRLCADYLKLMTLEKDESKLLSSDKFTCLTNSSDLIFELVINCLFLRHYL